MTSLESVGLSEQGVCEKPRPDRVVGEGEVPHVSHRIGRSERVFDREREADAFVDSVRCVVSRDGPVVFAWCLLGKHDRLGVRTESARVWTERQKRKSVPGTFLYGTFL